MTAPTAPVVQVWDIPEPPGPEVRVLVDRWGRAWTRVERDGRDLWHLNARSVITEYASWPCLFVSYFPLTDATGEVTGGE